MSDHALFQDSIGMPSVVFFGGGGVGGERNNYNFCAVFA